MSFFAPEVRVSALTSGRALGGQQGYPTARRRSKLCADLRSGREFGHRGKLGRADTRIQFGRNGHTRRKIIAGDGLAHLGADAEVEEAEFEFLCACLDDERVLGSEDAARDTRLLQADHAHAVIDTETLEYFAFGGVIHTAVREAAIDVGQKKPNHLPISYQNTQWFSRVPRGVQLSVPNAGSPWLCQSPVGVESGHRKAGVHR